LRGREPIPKGLTEEQKVFKIGPVLLDKRQLFIVVGSAFAYYLLYKQVYKVLPLTGAEAVLAFSPLMLLALFFAFARHDGRHMDFWLVRKVQNAFSPEVYLYKPDPQTRGVAGAFARVLPGAAEGTAGGAAQKTGAKGGARGTVRGRGAKASGRSPQRTGRMALPQRGGGPKGAKPSKAPKGAGANRSKKRPRRPRSAPELRDSVQKVLGIDGIYWEMLRLEDNSYVVIVEVEPLRMHLTGSDDKDRILSAAVGLYNRLDFPIVEMTRAKEGDVKDYAEEFRHLVTDVVEPGEQNLARSARDYLIFLDKIVREYNVHDRRSYFVLPYKPPTKPARGHRNEGFIKRLLGRLGLRPTKKATRQLQQEAKDAHNTLGARFDLIADFCAEAGAEARLLVGEELVDFVKDQSSGEKHYPKSKIYSPLSLETHGYGPLSERDLLRQIAWAEEVREDSPPAVGLADLTFSDKVAPAALRVHPDWVRVGGRYHATLFCIQYGPDVGLGDLRSVLNIPGRVKVVKYVEPVEEMRAIRKAGTAWAELEAAARTADNGDLITENERNRNRAHAHHVLEELQSGKQRLFDVSLLVHCEAETKEELYDLVDKVKKKLAGRRIEAKLSREEALAGFKSCLPLGKNLLTRRYANRNLMTYALSCFFLHATYTVDHRDGILLGVDHYSGGLVILNTRRLPNPHMNILGLSGAGKTVTVKLLSTRQRMRGHRVVVIDPVGDSRYGPVAEAMDGAYVPLGVGSSYRVNPCDLGHNYMNISVFTGAADNMTEEEYDRARTAALAGALDGKCLMLTRLVDLMLGAEGVGADRTESGLTAAQEGLVDRAWRELYADFGITEDPATHHLPPPTMPDFFRKIREPEFAEKLREVSEQLYVWEQGSLRHVFSGRTNVDLSNKYLVLQIANVKGRAKAAIMYGVLEFLNGRLSDREEPSDCYVDEFHSLLKYRMSAEFAEEMVRSGRARNNAMCPVTQEIDEFLHSEAGQVIFKQCASRLLLKTNRKTAEILSEFVDLSEDQQERLANFRKGQGYLMVGENLIPILIPISTAEERLFNTDPERDRLEALARAPGGGSPADRGGLRDPLGIPDEIASRPEAVARHLLSDTPAATVPEAMPKKLPPERPVPPLAVPTSTAGKPPLYAVVGKEASHVAYNLAGVFSDALAKRQRAAERPQADDDPLVLFVDAEGTLTSRFLEPNGIPRPDAFLAPDEAPPGYFARYAKRADGSRFAALSCPRHVALGPKNAIEAIEAGPYACVVVACGSGDENLYSEDWLLDATAVVAADAPDADGSPSEVSRDGADGPGVPWAPGVLAAALRAEELRGRNGTLLAPLGTPTAAVGGSGETGGAGAYRPLYPLAPKEAALMDGVTPYAFAAVEHAPTARTFRPLADALLKAPAADPAQEVAPRARDPKGT